MPWELEDSFEFGLAIPLQFCISWAAKDHSQWFGLIIWHNFVWGQGLLGTNAWCIE